jgi:hypothetical protein
MIIIHSVKMLFDEGFFNNNILPRMSSLYRTYLYLGNFFADA